LLASSQAVACGCGMALAPSKVFNSLKESNAYLVVDVKDDNSFTLRPFFRFVSLEKPENVTMVFPLKSLPKDFKAEKKTLSEFKLGEGFDEYDKAHDQQDIGKLLQRIGAGSVIGLPLYAIGIGGSFVIALFGTFVGFIGGIGSFGSGAVAHYDFEGGSMDIYDASSNSTLTELVTKLGFESEGKVKELVEKYKDYYVAVLTIDVQTPLPEGVMANYISQCPAQYEAAKAALKSDEEVDLKKLGLYRYSNYAHNMPYIIDSVGSTLSTDDCNFLSVALIDQAVGGLNEYRQTDQMKGILLSMGFSPTDTLFYPVSIVDTYNYPVAKQKYFVKMPTGKEFQFESSWATATALTSDTRWYEITNTNQDLQGKVAPAGIGTAISDLGIKGIQELNKWVWLIVALFYIASLALVRMLLDKSESPNWNTLKLFAFGAIVLAVILWNKDRQKAKWVAAGIAVWVALAALSILFG